MKLSLDQKNVSELAHELGISPALLPLAYGIPRKREASLPGNGARFRGGDAHRVADLEKRLKEAETKRDILNDHMLSRWIFKFY